MGLDRRPNKFASITVALLRTNTQKCCPPGSSMCHLMTPRLWGFWQNWKFTGECDCHTFWTKMLLNKGLKKVRHFPVMWDSPKLQHHISVTIGPIWLKFWPSLYLFLLRPPLKLKSVSKTKGNWAIDCLRHLEKSLRNSCRSCTRLRAAPQLTSAPELVCASPEALAGGFVVSNH